MPGTYTVTEQTYDKYVPQETHRVTVLAGQTATVSFNNVLRRGDLTVTKTSEDGLVEGVKFHLYGTSVSGLAVDEFAVTNSKGVATFEDVLIGSGYTLEEVDTAIRYVVPASQSAAVEWNSVTNKSFSNILKKFNVTVTKSDYEAGTAQGDASLAGATYGIYKGDQLVDTYVTDKNGQFTTSYYVCGDDWSIKENEPSEGYLLDTASYHVGAEAKLYTVERNSAPAIDVTEQVQKGNIAIIKHTDDGETKIETPEEGAVFAIYLEQKRVNNHDASTYMCVKSDFEPIVSEEEWYKCQEIKAKRVKQTLSAANTANKQKRHHGTKENRDLWGSKLQCSCGHSFRKNRWHKNNNMPWSYGYQCYNQLNNGSAASRRKAGVDDTGYCDQPMIADWKLDLMAKFIFERIWIDKNEVISKTCDLINECYRADVPKKVNLTGVASQIEKYRAKKNNLLDMRTDGEITKEEFAVQKQKIDAVLADLENEYASMLQSEQEIRVPDLRWDEIKETLTQVLDFSQPQVNPDLIRKFVSKIVPDGKNHFRWYMNLDGHDTTSLDVVTEGRKSNAVVTFDSGGDKPPLHTGDVITISQLKEKKSSTLSILHRLRLRSSNNTQPLKNRRFDD